MADITGTEYKPRQQEEEEAWEDTTGIYDADGNLLSLEDYAEDDNVGALDDDDDFDNNEGLVEDQEIYNLDTGWSIEDFVAAAPETPVADHKVTSVMCMYLNSNLPPLQSAPLPASLVSCMMSMPQSQNAGLALHLRGQTRDLPNSRQVHNGWCKERSVVWHAGKGRQAR